MTIVSQKKTCKILHLDLPLQNNYLCILFVYVFQVGHVGTGTYTAKGMG